MSEGEWISVVEWNPEDSRAQWVAIGGQVYDGYYRHGRWWNPYDSGHLLLGVTHWREKEQIPAPPKPL